MATLVIKKGDTLAALAKKYGTTVTELLKLNPNIQQRNAQGNLIYSGESINMPDASGSAAKTVSANDGTQAAAEITASKIAPDTTDIFSPDAYYLIKFNTDPDGPGPLSTSTVWLVDKSTKEIKPFTSRAAFNNFFADQGKTVEDFAAEGKIYDVPMELLSGNGAFSQEKGFKLMDSASGIQNDGQLPPPAPVKETVNTEAVQNHYGNPVNSDMHKTAFSALDGVLDLMKKDAEGFGVSQEFVTKLSTDPELLGFYVNAMAYGNYQMTDVMKDIKRRQLVENGNTQLANVKIIDENKTFDVFSKTAEGSAAKSNPLLSLPPRIGSIDTGMFNYSLYKMPDEAFKTLVQPVDWTTAEGKAEIEKIQASYYDVLTKKLEATTEQEKAMADYEYNKFKESMEKTYKMKLSDDALVAWKQIGELTTSYTEKGIGNSGLKEEALDRYLMDVRKTDERIREEKTDTTTEQRRQYYLNNATPEQIKNDLTEEERIAWGLKPGADTSNFFSAENLKKAYPGITDEEINMYKNLMIDENGNYRSKLYQTLFSNKFDTEQQKKDYQLSQAQAANTEKTEKAYAQFTNEDPFSKKTAEDMPPGSEETGTETPAKSPEIGSTTEQPGTEGTKSPVIGSTIPATGQTGSTSSNKSSVQTGVFTLKAYDMNNGGAVVYVKPGTYVPGISLTPPNAPTVPVVKPAESPTVGSTNTSWKTAQHVQIPNPAAIPQYTNVVKDPNSSALWGIKKATTSATSTPTITSTNTSWKTPQHTQIPNPAAIPNYTNVVKDPNSSALWGIKKTTTVNPTTSTPKPPTNSGYNPGTASNPFSSLTPWKTSQHTQISNPAAIPQYTSVVKDPNSSKLWGIKK